MVCLYIILLEGAVLKLVFSGLNGISWPQALALAAAVNLVSGIVGNVAGVKYDISVLEFEPNVSAVCGVSLGVEGMLMVFVLGRHYKRRSAITALTMNLASYAFLLIARFPDGIPSLF